MTVTKSPSRSYLIAMADAVNGVAEQESRAERMPSLGGTKSLQQLLPGGVRCLIPI